METNISEVVTQVDQQNKVEKSETSPTMTLKVIIDYMREGEREGNSQVSQFGTCTRAI